MWQMREEVNSQETNEEDGQEDYESEETGKEIIKDLAITLGAAQDPDL